MTNIFSCHWSDYTTAEGFAAGNLFRKTLKISAKCRLWGLPVSAPRAHSPRPPHGSGLHQDLRCKNTREGAPCFLRVEWSSSLPVLLLFLMPTSPSSCSLKWNVWFLFIFNLRPKKTTSWDSRCLPRIQKLLRFAFLMEVPRENFDESFLPCSVSLFT